MTNRFLPLGERPEWNDLERAALHNAGLKYCLSMMENGELTVEEALIAAILFLCESNETLMEMAIEASLKQKTVYLTK